ncbi:RNA polymerase III subunit C82 [Neocucurbitaria cava]|uniref:DNA-directed RNA polymerase III subunit RPC3 n=1 Tax=Neocucurbitaria cava TaxID=798079 RepID=A0A9W9CM15_9PLEO|nr:RNA polymerase III subunit C82 [Neocucurbitaria cava]
MSYHQRETPVLAELCTFLVEDVYGELAARVFSILARHGRQTLAAVARASYLNSRQIKYGLVILLQQHLVFHSGSDAPVTYYEIDWQTSYTLARFGKAAKLVEDRFGKKAANVMRPTSPAETESDDEEDDGIVNGAGVKRKRPNGVVNGVVNGVPSELNDAKPDSKPNGVVNGNSEVNGNNEVNGVHTAKVNGTTQERPTDDVKHNADEHDNDDIDSEDELYDIQRLIRTGWVTTVTDTQYLSPGDMHHMLEQQAIEEEFAGVTPTGIKDKDRLHRSTLRLKRQMRDECLTVPNFSRKRRAEEPAYSASNKRVKVNGASAWAPGSVSSPEDHLVIRVSTDKIGVAMRTEQLVQLVEQRLGFVTARVYQTMLRMLEPSIPRCSEEWAEPPLPSGEPAMDTSIDPRLLVTARDVAKKLKDLDICEGLDPNAIVLVTKRGHVRSTGSLSNPTDPSKLSIDEKTRIVDRHIQLLSDDPFHFVTWHSRAGHSQWQIEFEEIAKALIQSEIEKTVSARKGALGVKLIRALRKRGKLDERGTCNAMMMSAGDIRNVINDLTVQGFVQTQEIPKVERREAKHSLHLIWYDRQRAREKLLHDTYKGMVRILQRIAYERVKVQNLLAKAERSDVVGNEEKWLSKDELGALRKWKEVQEKLLLQLFREDELVATLRDFYGPLVSV